MRVQFVLPAPSDVPVGGYKVAYTYADHLAVLGHSVTVVHCFMPRMRNPKSWARLGAAYADHLHRPDQIAPWHEGEGSVAWRLVPYSSGRLPWLRAADATVLTSALTSERFVPTRRLGVVLQLVYDYEYWRAGSEEERIRIARSLSRPGIRLIATSQAVGRMLAAIGSEPVAWARPGIDLSTFRCRVPQSKRMRIIGFAWRDGKARGLDHLLRALDSLRNHHPSWRFACFGAGRAACPDWIERHGVLTSTDLVEFYNACAVFVLPSLFEGWGLPAAEAMACGACVVTTRNGGVEDFAIDGKNAIMVEPGSSRALECGIEKAMNNAQLRAKLSDGGLETTVGLSELEACRKFEDLLFCAVGNCRA